MVGGLFCFRIFSPRTPPTSVRERTDVAVNAPGALASRPSDHLVRSVRESITSNDRGAVVETHTDVETSTDRERKQPMSRTLVLAFACAMVGSSLASFGAQSFPISSLDARACGAGGDARGWRMRHRLSPRPLWRLPAERGRRDRAGGPGAPGGGTARRRRTARRLRGGIPLAPAVPALRHPLIACQFRPANAAASRSRLPRSCGTRIVGLVAHRRGVTRPNHGSCAISAKDRSRQGSIKARLTRETTR